MDMRALERAVQGGMLMMQKRLVLMETIGETLVSSTVRRFEEGKDPDGNAWEPTGRGGQILADKGRLKSSMVYEAGPDMVVWGSNVEYAAIHQYGGEIKAKNGPYLTFKIASGNFVRVKSVTIPARPYLGVSKDDKEEIRYMMRAYIARGLGLK